MYIHFTCHSHLLPQIANTKLPSQYRYCQDYSGSNTSTVYSTQLPPCTTAHIIFPAPSKRKLLPPRGTPRKECAETISCLVNPRSKAQLLKMVTDSHSSSICTAFTDHISAPFSAWLINPFIHSKPAAPGAPHLAETAAPPVTSALKNSRTIQADLCSLVLGGGFGGIGFFSLQVNLNCSLILSTSCISLNTVEQARVLPK